MKTSEQAYTWGLVAGMNLVAQDRGCLPNPEIEDQRGSGRHAGQE